MNLSTLREEIKKCPRGLREGISCFPPMAHQGHLKGENVTWHVIKCQKLRSVATAKEYNAGSVESPETYHLLFGFSQDSAPVFLLYIRARSHSFERAAIEQFTPYGTISFTKSRFVASTREHIGYFIDAIAVTNFYGQFDGRHA